MGNPPPCWPGEHFLNPSKCGHFCYPPCICVANKMREMVSHRELRDRGRLGNLHCTALRERSILIKTRDA
jgi:hypothetical protein